MSEVKERVIKEYEELEIKHNKLSKFMQSDAFTKIPTLQQVLLVNQSEAMLLYLNILYQRIKLWQD